MTDLPSLENTENRNKETVLNKTPSTQYSFTAICFSTFITVFLAELGDKTQVATLLLSAQSGRPLIVFIGSASALICSSLVGVFLGRWLGNKIDPERFNKIAGLVMLILGFWLFFQAAKSLLIL